jgi:2-dehydropantoate 2-reductase
MYSVVLDTCSKTALNESSMLADAKNGRTTEIDYINGYIIKLASKHGLAAPQNKLLARLVRIVVSLRRDLERGFIPFTP